MDDLRRVVESMRAAAAEAGVQLVTGDTRWSIEARATDLHYPQRVSASSRKMSTSRRPGHSG